MFDLINFIKIVVLRIYRVGNSSVNSSLKVSLKSVNALLQSFINSANSLSGLILKSYTELEIPRLSSIISLVLVL